MADLLQLRGGGIGNFMADTELLKKILDAVKSLEASSYYDFDLLWKKLYKTKGTKDTLTKEEFEMMDFLVRAMQDLGYIRGVLEEMRGGEK